MWDTAEKTLKVDNMPSFDDIMDFSNHHSDGRYGNSFFI